MTVEMIEREKGRILTLRLSGKLTKQDYELFTPEIERRIEEHGTIRMLAEMHDLDGWETGALWEDLKFDRKHFNDVEHLALVGDKGWEEAMATFCKPFTTAEVRYFDVDEFDEAQRWLRESIPPEEGEAA